MTTNEPAQADPASLPADELQLLDACHVQTLFALGKLSALVARLGHDRDTPDEHARRLAREAGAFFSSTSRKHHEDEERLVFPPLLDSGDALLVQSVQRLQQDHAWLEEDWLELAPQVDAIAYGQNWYDLDLLREGTLVFAELLRDHMALEESLIYPEARLRLAAARESDVGRKLAAEKRAGRSEPSAQP